MASCSKCLSVTTAQFMIITMLCTFALQKFPFVQTILSCCFSDFITLPTYLLLAVFQFRQLSTKSYRLSGRYNCFRMLSTCIPTYLFCIYLIPRQITPIIGICGYLPTFLLNFVDYDCIFLFILPSDVNKLIQNRYLLN